MPSRDDYLDELLNGISSEDEKVVPDRQEAPDIDAISEMTEEQIAELLAAGTGNSAEDRVEYGRKPEEIAAPESDVLDILEGTKDGELREIQDLLEKSDRNESIRANGQSEEEENPAARLLADIEEAGESDVAGNTADSSGERALKKEARRQEKAAKKEAKKLARQAAKAEKATKQKQSRGRKKEAEASEREQLQTGKAEKAAAQDYDDLMMDKNLLDSIVSGAGKAGRRFADAVPQTREEPDNGIGDLLNYAKADLDSADSPEAAWTDNGNSSPELDIMALDMSEADALIAERPERGDEKGSKEGLLSKVFSFLTEEDEPEAENEDVKLSEENEEILQELDNEVPKKSGKTKKPKKKKAAKKEKKEKPKKPPKPKKEKKPKEAEVYPPGKRLTLKKAFPVIAFGASLAAALLIFTNLSVDYKDKQTARDAYDAGDYETCYQNLFGKKLNETEAEMYGRSESILYIRLWYREYEAFVKQGAEVEALDSLIQTVEEYPGLYEYAAKWNAGMDVYAIYLDILDTLYNKYGITEAQAREIAAVKTDLEYTRIVTAVAGGKSYENWRDAYMMSGGNGDSGNSGADGSIPERSNPDSGEELEDRLPEEEGVGTDDFIE